MANFAHISEIKTHIRDKIMDKKVQKTINFSDKNAYIGRKRVKKVQKTDQKRIYRRKLCEIVRNLEEKSIYRDKKGEKRCKKRRKTHI